MLGSRLLQAQELKEATWPCNAVVDHVNDMQYDVTSLPFPPSGPGPIVNDRNSSCVLHESLETESQQKLKTG